MNSFRNGLTVGILLLLATFSPQFFSDIHTIAVSIHRYCTLPGDEKRD